MKNIIIFILSILIFIGVIVFLPEYEIKELNVTQHIDEKSDFNVIGVKGITDLEKYYKGIIAFDKFNIRLKITLKSKFDGLNSTLDNSEQMYANNMLDIKKWYGCENYEEYKRIFTEVSEYKKSSGELLHAELKYDTFKIVEDGLIFDAMLIYENKNVDLKVKLYNKELENETVLKFVEINGVKIDER